MTNNQRSSETLKLKDKLTASKDKAAALLPNDTIANLHLNIEHLQRALREEIEINQELLRMTVGIEESNRSVRENLSVIRKEKAELAEVVKNMEKESRGASLGSSTHSLMIECESLKKESEELKKSLREGGVQQAEEPANPEDTPPAYSYISSEHARIVALNIKRMQKESKDLGIQYNLLQRKQLDLNAEIEEAKKKNASNDEEEFTLQKELEQERERHKEFIHKFKNLEEIVLNLQNQFRPLKEQGKADQIVPSLLKFLEDMSLEVRSDTPLTQRAYKSTRPTALSTGASKKKTVAILGRKKNKVKKSIEEE
eukprot:TRINITY_DN3913_c0_g1_i2.p1 TRINITY_DN3913_c0_g1~~TRINITY_DN3913_c0_g1_i2.p1  ORF type:complete len:313 (-),score=82.52 TRINITY_DN3913_c0_g1_i2:49-987(-)